MEIRYQNYVKSKYITLTPKLLVKILKSFVLLFRDTFIYKM